MKNILLIGATSAIAGRYARQEAAEGSALFIVGRSSDRLQSSASDLAVRGAGSVTLHVMDVLDFDTHGQMLEQAWRTLGRVDVALIAHGTLPDAGACMGDMAIAAREFGVNATATILLMERIGNRMLEQGSGTLAVISSVAGDRGRASNYLYGSAKAAVTAYASGLRQRMRGTGVNVLTIKPGFVDTPMTAGFRKGPLWSSPDRIAAGIRRAIRRRRSVAYLPGFWRYIMLVITHIPESVFRRIGL